MKLIWTLTALLLALLTLLWSGFRNRPAPFAAVSQPQPALATVPVPPGLPAPVERWIRALYGDAIPVVTSAVISGRGAITLNGLTLPVRFRFTHLAGKDYRHYFEATWFGMPLLKINESYVAGKERMEFPWGVQANNPKLDQGGNLGMWAEMMLWLPAALATDPQVRWEAVDDETAFMIVPFGNARERFLVRFTADGRSIRYWEVMRYQNGGGEKKPWINGTWFEGNAGKPWADFRAEDIRFNVDVDVRARGLP